MDCVLSCSLAIVFLTGSIAISFIGPMGSTKERFLASLGPDQKRRYASVTNTRRVIYIQGLTLGIALSMMAISQLKKMNSIITPCLAAAITLVTTYLYYILAPKPQSNVIGFTNKEQRVLWYAIYRRMQLIYHAGLLLGIIAAFFLAKGMCQWK